MTSSWTGESPTPRTGTTRSGAILGVVLIILLLLAILGVALLQIAESNSTETSKTISSSEAFWLAEAGLANAMGLLAARELPFEDLGVFGTAALTDSMDTGDYSVDVLTVAGWHNVGNPVKRYMVRSTGTSAGNMTEVVEISMSLYFLPTRIFASGDVILSGGSDITADTASNSDINLTGGSRIEGDATPGPGSAVNNPAQVSGSSVPASDVVLLSPVDPIALADAAVNNNNAAIHPGHIHHGRLELTGGTDITLPEGTYYFTGVSISGNSRITTAGPVIVYCTGTFDISGGSFLNPSADPAELLIFITASTGVLKWSGGSESHATIYAPSIPAATISGGGEFNGTITVGGDLTVTGGSDIDIGSGGTRFRPLGQTWRQTSG